MAGGPPPSANVTAEAGKLPTLSVRPFWPFQVAESGLWEEALVKAPGGGWARAHIQLASICLEEGKLFSPEHKRALWAWWLQPEATTMVVQLSGPSGVEGRQRSRVQDAEEQQVGPASGRWAVSPPPGDMWVA